MELQGSTAQTPEILKRSRGRPRKFPTPPLGVVFPKRGRGRPRVNSPLAQQLVNSPLAQQLVNSPPAQQLVNALPETDLGQQPPPPSVEIFAKRGPGRPPKSPAAALLADGTFEPRPRGRPPKAASVQPLQAFPKRAWGRGRGRGRGRPPKTVVDIGGEAGKELGRLRAEVREIRDTLVNRLTRLEEGVQMIRYDMQRFTQTATTNGRPDTLTPQVAEEEVHGLQENYQL